MAIDQPSGVVHLKTSNLLDAYGTIDADLIPRAVWGAVLQGNVSIAPPHPWHSSVTTFAQGSLEYNSTLGMYTWQIGNVPGARGNCLEDTFVLWYVINGSNVVQYQLSPFVGDSVGSGCSGGGGENVAASRHIGQPAPKSLAMTIESSPSTGVRSVKAGKGPATTLKPAPLEFDESHSMPSVMTWRSTRTGDSKLLWQLQVLGREGGLTGVLTRFDFASPGGKLPMTWVCAGWNLMGANRLTPAPEQKSSEGTLPVIALEPLW